jgi:hypothetical protein
MKKVCTDIPKWKYLSGIPKAQRDADLLAETALKQEQESQLTLELNDISESSSNEQEENQEVLADMMEEEEEEEEGANEEEYSATM